MQLSDSLDIQALLRRASQNSVSLGIFLLCVPVIAFGIGAATFGAVDKFPFFLWLIIAVPIIMGESALRPHLRI